MSRQTAYALRERPGAESFAAAWDAAIAAARRRRAAQRPPGEWERGVEGVLRPVRYHGRITAFERHYDMAAFRRVLARADRILEKHDREESGFYSPWTAELLSASANPAPPGRPRAAPRKKGE